MDPTPANRRRPPLMDSPSPYALLPLPAPPDGTPRAIVAATASLRASWRRSGSPTAPSGVEVQSALEREIGRPTAKVDPRAFLRLSAGVRDAYRHQAVALMSGRSIGGGTWTAEATAGVVVALGGLELALGRGR